MSRRSSLSDGSNDEAAGPDAVPASPATGGGFGGGGGGSGLGAPPAASTRMVNTYVRVRPLLKDEAKKIPDYHPIARPALITATQNADPETQAALADSSAAGGQQAFGPAAGTGSELVVVMDPDKKFTRRKGGVFAFKRVFPSSNLNEFEDPPVRPLPVSTVADVFAALRPVVENVCNRINSAVIVCGGSKSGKMTTMFGDTAGVDVEGRGLLPRFAADVFRAMQSVKPLNAEVKSEVEFIEVSGDTITDLLLPAAERASAFPVKLKDEGQTLVTLVGATRLAVSDGPMMMSHIKFGLRSARKKDAHSHLILNFRVTEKADFEHPDDSTQRVSKVTKYWTQFALLSSMPTAFVRCVDIAMQRDSAASTSLKVPVRDSMVTRIIADAFGGNCDTHCVLCASPFFAHSKESFSALETVAKFSKVRTRPSVVTDSQTSTFRRLHDEMSGLSSELRQTTSAQSMVQQELDSRQAKLEETAQALACQRAMLNESEQRYSANEIVKIVKALRLLRRRRSGDAYRKQLEAELAQADEALKTSLSGVVRISAETEQIAEDVDRVRAQRAAREKANALAAEELAALKARRDAADARRGGYSAQLEAARAEHALALEQVAARQRREAAELAAEEAAVADAERQRAALQQEIAALDAPAKRLAAAKATNAKLLKEQADLAREIANMELEIANVEAQLKQPEGCSCVIQ